MGLVRKKNILGVMMQCVFLMGMMSVYWRVVVTAGPLEIQRLIGSLDHLMLKGVMQVRTVRTPDVAAKEMLFMVFQGCSLLSHRIDLRAFAERMKFSTMCVFFIALGRCCLLPAGALGLACQWLALRGESGRSFPRD